MLFILFVVYDCIALLGGNKIWKKWHLKSLLHERRNLFFDFFIRQACPINRIQLAHPSLSWVIA